MKPAVKSSGNIGKSIGVWASRACYEVIFTSRNFEHAKEAARIAGRISARISKAESINEAVTKADLVL